MTRGRVRWRAKAADRSVRPTRAIAWVLRFAQGRLCRKERDKDGAPKIESGVKPKTRGVRIVDVGIWDVRIWDVRIWDVRIWGVHV